uniref:CRISPR system Cms protein Csm4 n=1 Tax=Archaeoglobus fulgidus TaxID=2234 RepID=A0A7C2NLS4_ARCFL
MKAKVFKLYFKTPLRIGEAGIGLERAGDILHSDTLFGAMATALAKLNEDVEEFIKRVSAGELRFSSCFPFENGKYYLPAPQLPVERKWRFLSLENFEKVISGEIEVKGDETPYMKFEVPKVVLDRVTSNSGIYYLTAVKFGDNSGLYFMVDGNDGLIKKALKFLQDEGIGGKRTWGLGKFEMKEDEIQIRESGEFYTTLSLTYPTSLDSVVYWKPVVRGGWINTAKATIRKPKVIMASEGSIFNEAEEGDVINLSIAYSDLSKETGHDVYLNGRSFLVRMVIPDET